MSMFGRPAPRPLCGCYFGSLHSPKYLPLVGSSVHATILATSSSTKLTQTFTSKESLEKVNYIFPLYDGVSVVSFVVRINEDRTLHGVVHEKVQAKAIFGKAVSEGQTAGLLEQSNEASDVFSTSLGNIPAGATIAVDICFVGELKNDAETDGIKFTIPTYIAPRYGSAPSVSLIDGVSAVPNKGMFITVDANMPTESPIKGIQSPSHPISVSMGVLSSAKDEEMSMNKASATLSQKDTALDKDFVIVVAAKDSGDPTAIMETHPTMKHQRAIMASLVPKFSLPPARPEIIFIADRSGSMEGNVGMLKDALKVFLKSLPAGVKFNILSFGSRHSTLWPKSEGYSKITLTEALAHVDSFGADYGGTETLSAIKAAVENRYTDLPLDMVLLTDGDIWQQGQAFEYLAEEVEKTKGGIRLFPLGIGSGVSHSLVEGLARSGNGFAQTVQDGERMDKRVVRMLRGALSPHIYDYTLEVKYQAEDDFDMVDKVYEEEDVQSVASSETTLKSKKNPVKKVISLFNKKENPEREPIKAADEPLPDVSVPKILQGPHKIPSLFAFSRTTVYLLLSPETIQKNPKTLVLRATSGAGPLHLDIPIQTLSQPGATVHQLAARKVVQDLEEGRGWVHDAKDEGAKIKDRYPSRFDDVIKREAVRLGETYQIANRWCSFVAVPAESQAAALAAARKQAEEAVSAPAKRQAGSEVDDQIDYSDEDMGFGYFDDPLAPAAVPAAAGPVYHSHAARNSAPSTGAVAPPGAEKCKKTSVGGPGGPALASASYSMAPPDLRPDMRFSAPRGPPAAAPTSMPYASFSAATPPPPTGGAGSGGAAPAPRFRTRQPPRHSTGGQAPRKQMMASPANTFENKGLAYAEDEVEAEEDEMEATEEVDSGAEVGPAFKVFDPKSLDPQDYGLKGGEGDEDQEMEGAAPAPATDSQRVHRLIELQDFDGYWEDGARLWAAMGVERDEAAKAAPTMDAVWITVLVLCFLEQKMGGEKEVWEMVADKATMWLDEQKIDDRKGLEAAAVKVVKA